MTHIFGMIQDFKLSYLVDWFFFFFFLFNADSNFRSRSPVSAKLSMCVHSWETYALLISTKINYNLTAYDAFIFYYVFF